MVNRIEVAFKSEYRDAAAERVLKAAKESGLPLTDVRRVRAFSVDKNLQPEDVRIVTKELLTDRIVEDSSFDSNSPLAAKRPFSYVIEIGFKPGVMDTTGQTVADAMGDVLGMRFSGDEGVYTSTQYVVEGDVTEEELHRFTAEQLANDNVERWKITSYEKFREGEHNFDIPKVRISRVPEVEEIELRDDEQMMKVNTQRSLALNLEEMSVIREYFAREGVREERRKLGMPENPTDVEIEVLGQTWSEHCKHKIFNAQVEYTDEHGQVELIDSLFDTCIKEPSLELKARLPRIVSILDDNAGVIRFNDKWLLAIKSETHNSPSKENPPGGVETGIVGVKRDPMGTGMGARTIFGMYGFCTGNPLEKNVVYRARSGDEGIIFHPKIHP